MAFQRAVARSGPESNIKRTFRRAIKASNINEARFSCSRFFFGSRVLGVGCPFSDVWCRPNAQDQNDIYEFLSGVPITSRTRFLSLHEPDQLEAFQQTAHYMKYALAAYGWPMYLLGHSKTGLCRLTSHMRYGVDPL